MSIRRTDNSDEAATAMAAAGDAPAFTLTRAELAKVRDALREAEANARFDRSRAYSAQRKRATQALLDAILEARAIIDPEPRPNTS
jgi:hypothetical protein